jgi:prepilin-type N-terminal cleavage/methylation domain-containing protein
MRRRDGFTLVELLVAFFVFSVALGGLLPLVTQSVAALSRAQGEAEVARLGEQRLREVLASAQAGTLPEVGVRHGQFDEPWADYLWELRVDPAAMPLPPDVEPERSESSSVFRIADPLASTDDGEQRQTLFLVTLYVHEDGTEPEQGQVFSIFVVEPGTLPAAPGEGSGAAQDGGDADLDPDGAEPPELEGDGEKSLDRDDRYRWPRSDPQGGRDRG